MNKKFVSLIALAPLMTSCASIISKSDYNVNFTSAPKSKVTITDEKGNDIFSGETPTSTTLKVSDGFFSKANYQAKFSKKGYDDRTISINPNLDPWYFANILFGGLIGMLIVDPATGAMYKIDKELITVNLDKSTASVIENDDDSINKGTISISQIPKEYRKYLTEIK